MALTWHTAVLALSLGLAAIPSSAQPPAQSLSQPLPPAKPGDKEQPMRVTISGPRGPGTDAAMQKVRQAALRLGGALTIEKARAALANKTNMTFGADYTAPPMKRYDAARHLIAETPAQPVRGSGTQVEYIAPDGKTYLWYPANPRVVIGDWTLEQHPFRLVMAEGFAVFDLVNLCFHYLPTDPGPGAVAGTSCSPAYMYMKRVRESADGDVLGLARPSAPPFVLERDQTTLDALRKKAGRP